jgi:uncharacterized phage protein (TIGR02218 family)
MKTLPLTLTDRVVRPARLLVITRRDGTVMRVAEAQSAITSGGNVYAPLAGCQISAVKHTIGGDTASMEIRGAHSNTPGAAAFLTSDIDIGLYDSAAVSLFIVNRANPTTLGLMFTGTIQPVSYDISGMVSFDVRGPSIGAGANYIQTFAPMCRTDLFSPLCGVNPDSYALSATVTAVVNRFNFTVSITPADNYLNGGTVLTDSGVAFEIAAQIGGSLTAYLPFHRVLAGGMGLTLWPGCDKRLASCHSKFNNTLNFQGEPHSIGVYASIGGA